MNKNFNVKSAYRFIQRTQAQTYGECSSTHTHALLWKAIWKLNIPQKVCIFVWQACKEGLPSLHNLSRRGVVVNNVSTFCGMSPEDSSHAIFYCPENLYWRHNFLPLMKEAEQNLKLRELVESGS